MFPLHCSSSLVTPRKELNSSGDLIFVTIAEGTPLDPLALGATRDYACGLIGLYVHSLKADAWGPGCNKPASRC